MRLWRCMTGVTGSSFAWPDLPIAQRRVAQFVGWVPETLDAAPVGIDDESRSREAQSHTMTAPCGCAAQPKTHSVGHLAIRVWPSNPTTISQGTTSGGFWRESVQTLECRRRSVGTTGRNSFHGHWTCGLTGTRSRLISVDLAHRPTTKGTMLRQTSGKNGTTNIQNGPDSGAGSSAMRRSFLLDHFNNGSPPWAVDVFSSALIDRGGCE